MKQAFLARYCGVRKFSEIYQVAKYRKLVIPGHGGDLVPYLLYTAQYRCMIAFIVIKRVNALALMQLLLRLSSV